MLAGESYGLIGEPGRLVSRKATAPLLRKPIMLELNGVALATQSTPDVPNAIPSGRSPGPKLWKSFSEFGFG